MFLAFMAVAAAQLYVPASIIVRYEAILARGKTYKFRARPVDPYDAMRGRYVALGFDDATTVTVRGARYEHGETVYVTLAVKPDGYARFAEASRTPPASGDYVKTTMDWDYAGKNWGRVIVPFDRYYMEESVAPEAEKAYREHATRKRQDAYATVRVLDGGAVLENVYVEGQPIREFARTVRKEKTAGE
jgi:uncharacterized membrane-anchored protein